MERKNLREELENGSLLRYYKHIFLEKQDRDALMAVLACLHDSHVIVLVQATGSKAEAESSDSKPILMPDLLKNDEGTFFPVFSDVQQLPAEYAEHFSFVKLPAVRCIETALSQKEITGLVVDAFTEAMIIPRNSAAIMLKMRNHLE